MRAAAFCICLASDKRVLSLSRNNADIYPGRMKKNGRRNGRLLRNMLHTHLSVHSAPSYSHLITLSSYFLRDKKASILFAHCITHEATANVAISLLFPEIREVPLLSKPQTDAFPTYLRGNRGERESNCPFDRPPARQVEYDA